MSLKPLGDLIVVEPAPNEEKIGSFYLSEGAQEEAKHGKIIAAGPGKQHEHWFEPQELKVGMTVLYSEFAKEKIKFQGREFYVMHPADIVGVME